MPEHSILEERLYNHRSALSYATAHRPADDASQLAVNLDDSAWLLAWNDFAQQQQAWSDSPVPVFPPGPRPPPPPPPPPPPVHDLDQLPPRASRPLPAQQYYSAPAAQALWPSDLSHASAQWSAASPVPPAAAVATTTADMTSSIAHAASAGYAVSSMASASTPLAPAAEAPTWTRQLPEYSARSDPALQPTAVSSQLLPYAPVQQPVRSLEPLPPSHASSNPEAALIPASAGPVRSKKRKRPFNGPASPAGPEAHVALWKGRCGPLDDSTREKSRSLRQYGACWRCRKYRKPCSNGPEMCETCVTSGFRVWPSELGCRRGNLESYVDVLLPTNAEFVFSSSRLGHNKRDPWRRMLDASTIEAAQKARALTTEDKRWGVLIRKVLGTRTFGPEFVELFEIIAKFQQAAVNEHPALDAALSMLNATTDFYYTFVKIDGDDYQMQDPVRTVRTIRKSFSRALRMVLNGCLSGRANEWLPCLLACCMLAASVVTFTDAAVRIPSELREAIWPDLTAVVITIKMSCYTTVCHLLNALAKGGKPLKMSCWRIEDVTDPATGECVTKKNENGMRILGNDDASFDGVRALQQWLEAHGNVVEVGRTWNSSQPFSMAQVPAICAMAMLFDA